MHDGVNPPASLPQGPQELPRMSRMDLRQTGLSIKLRFLLTLFTLAVVPAIGLVLLLGDPFGMDQQAMLGAAAALQAQAQAQALNQALVERQQAVLALASAPASALLHFSLQHDPMALASLVVDQHGTIVASGNFQDHPGMPLSQAQ